MSERVVEAVAEAEGVHPTELSTPLFEAVDPDALDALFRTAGPSVSVTFRFCGHDVTVSRGGTVTVERVRGPAASEGDASMVPSSGEASGTGERGS